MGTSLAEDLRRDLACEDLLECFHGLTGLDREVFAVLARADRTLTVDDIAGRVDRERSTVYRAAQRLVEAGLVRKDQIDYERGGYAHVYRAVGADRIADDMQRMLNDWYAKMGQLIAEFREEYPDEQPGVD